MFKPFTGEPRNGEGNWQLILSKHKTCFHPHQPHLLKASEHNTNYVCQALAVAFFDSNKQVCACNGASVRFSCQCHYKCRRKCKNFLPAQFVLPINHQSIRKHVLPVAHFGSAALSCCRDLLAHPAGESALAAMQHRPCLAPIPRSLT